MKNILPSGVKHTKNIVGNSGKKKAGNIKEEKKEKSKTK